MGARNVLVDNNPPPGRNFRTVCTGACNADTPAITRCVARRHHCADDPRESERRSDTHLFPADTRALERPHVRRRRVSLLPLHRWRLAGLVAERPPAAWHRPFDADRAGTQEGSDPLRHRPHLECSPVAWPCQLPHRWCPAANRVLLLRRSAAVSMAEATDATPRDGWDSAWLLRAPALGPRTGLRHPRRGYRLPRPARQSGGMARSSNPPGEPPLSAGLLRSRGPAEFDTGARLDAYWRTDGN